MKLRKLLSIALITAMTATMLIGCGSSDDTADTASTSDSTSSDSTSTDSSSEERITIVVDGNTFTEDSAEWVAAYTEVTQMEKYSNIDFVLMDYDADYYTTTSIAMASGEQRDILAVQSIDKLKAWAQSGVVLSIEEYAEVAGDDLEAEYGSILDSCSVDDEVYGIANNVNTWAIYYNKSVFDEAGIDYPSETDPMTWDEYQELAIALTSGSGTDKIYGTLEIEWPQFWYAEAILTLEGAESFYTEDGTASNIEDPAFAEALQNKMDRMYVYESTPTYADVVSSATGVQAFCNGNYGMGIFGTWMLNFLIDEETYPRDFNVGMAPMPVAEEGDDMATFGSTNYLCVGSTSVDPQLAYEIAKDIEDTYCAYTLTAAGNQSLDQPNVYITHEEILGDEGITVELLTYLLANEDITVYPEKFSQAGSTDYLAVITEEMQLLFAQEQTVEETIANIKERGDEVIAEAIADGE